jgi:DTW domain-containing protein YfiP
MMINQVRNCSEFNAIHRTNARTTAADHKPRASVFLAPPRQCCLVCRRPAAACYCALVKPFNSHPRFVILIQPREAKHRLATGRMAHLCIANSSLIEGVDFSHHQQVEAIIHDPNVFSVLLYPERSSIDLSALSTDERKGVMPAGKEFVVFIPDGTWKTARKIVRLSRNLNTLPRVSFNPPTRSMYRIRRQPRPNFYCTLEAVHHVIDLFALSNNPGVTTPRPHDNLLEVFHFAINRQLSYTPQER